MATIGRRWLMDRRNVEPADLAEIPIPLSSINDARLEGLLDLNGVALEDFILQSMGIRGNLRKSIEEFLRFRMFFQDGNVPDDALHVPKQAMIASYSKLLERCLDEFMGRDAFMVAYQAVPDQGVGIVVAQYTNEGKTHVGDDSILTDFCRETIDIHRGCGTNNFSDSLSTSYQPKIGAVSMVKPLEYFRWTVDSAYADSRHVIDTFMREAG